MTEVRKFNAVTKKVRTCVENMDRLMVFHLSGCLPTQDEDFGPTDTIFNLPLGSGPTSPKEYHC